MKKSFLVWMICTGTLAGSFFPFRHAASQQTDSGRYKDEMTGSSFLMPEGWEAKKDAWTDGFIEPGVIQLVKDEDIIIIKKAGSAKAFEEKKQALQKIPAEYSDDLVAINMLAYNHLVASLRGQDEREGFYEGYFLNQENNNYAIELYSRSETYPANKDIIRNLVNSIQYP